MRKHESNDPIELFAFPVTIVIFIIAMYWINKLEEKGQFLLFVVHDLFILNGMGVLSLIFAFLILAIGIYFIITKKAVEPKKVVMPMLGLALLFGGMGFGLAHDVGDHLVDVVYYAAGYTKEEEVVIEKYWTDSSGNYIFYNYELSDGRIFTGRYRGLGFGNIQQGATYQIRYLPKTEKLLSIKRVN